MSMFSWDEAAEDREKHGCINISCLVERVFVVISRTFNLILNPCEKKFNQEKSLDSIYNFPVFYINFSFHNIMSVMLGSSALMWASLSHINSQL